MSNKDDKLHCYRVRFKETYMPHTVERECHTTSEQAIIDFYGLLEPDIEWYNIIICVDDEESKSDNDEKPIR